MTNIEIANHLIHLLQTKVEPDMELNNAFNALYEVADCEYEKGQLLAKGHITFADKNLPDIDFVFGESMASAYDAFAAGYETRIYLDEAWNRAARFCATEPLQEILCEVQDNYAIVAHEDVSEFLLINPRKDVVDWALKHKDELGLNKVKPEFIEKHQAIPELKELILKALKGE